MPTKPIAVQRLGDQPLIIRVLPVDGAARSPFLGARALLILSDLSSKSTPFPDLPSQSFGLSPAEARLASLIAAGVSPEQSAKKLGIARETARTQLKAVFSKTHTHGQGELIAVLSRL
jgi:DNA-binding CsgD family transcriptional regulator